MKRMFVLKITMTATTVLLVAGMATVFAVETRGGDPVQSLGKYDLSPVQTFCVTTTQNGLKWTGYYNRQEGVVQQLSAPGWSSSHYILGQTEWDYREGGTLILRKKPMQDALAQTLKIESDLSSLQKGKMTRESALDEKMNGTLCEAYHIQDGPGQAQNTFVYINTVTGRPARMKSDKPALDLTITYDPPLPPDFFKVPVNAGIETIDARAYFEKKYPLDGALFKKEGLGQIFAVHEVAQDAAGCFYIICSCRLTPVVRDVLKDIPDDQGVGKFMMDDRAKLPFHYLTLAEVHESGMQIMYLLAVPEKSLAPEDICQLPVTMGSSDAILKTGRAARGPDGGTDVHIAVNLEAKLQLNAPTLRQFAGRAYDETVPLIGMVGDITVIGPRTDAGLSSKEIYLEELNRRLAKYLVHDGKIDP